jgi:hypothetical protein
VTNFVTNRCVTMSHKLGGLLAQIEARVLDDTVPLSSLLQKCIVLGGQAGSEKMRDRARRELNGYAGSETVPDYRHVPAAVMAVITNKVGCNGITPSGSTIPFSPPRSATSSARRSTWRTRSSAEGSANWRRWPARTQMSIASSRAGPASSRTR